MYFSFRNLQRALLILLLTLQCPKWFSQSYYFGEAPVNWELRKKYSLPPEADKYAGSDLVILEEKVELHFLSSSNEKVIRNLKYKINSPKGLDQLKHYTMPESFDFALESELNKQGRRARIKIPHLKGFKINVFAARKYAREKWSNVSVKDRYETLRWIKPSGEFSDEEIMVFQLGMLTVGDVLEIYYEAEFDGRYGANLFYFNGPYPKLKCEYQLVYRTSKLHQEAKCFLPLNIEPASIHSSNVNYDHYALTTTTIQLTNLAANNYPLNSFEAGKLPHLYVDFGYYRSLVRYVDKEYQFSAPTRAKNFEWVVIHDTSIAKQPKFNDKQSETLRKFTNTLPPVGTDSQNVVFMKAFSDTLNHFRYLNPNHLFYNESNLYDVFTADHLMKRRLPGHTLAKLYTDVLKDNHIFYYLANVEDKRFSEHTQTNRVHYGYEHELFALPLKTNFVYFLPRYDGLNYYPNEFPFYFENATAALTPLNFQATTKAKDKKVFTMRKIRGSTFNDNKRNEEAIVKIALDSMTIRLNTKETLSGQYSTLLRHQYLGECIDSTVATHYFRKCTDKPHLGGQKIKVISKHSEFPFEHAFNCSGNILLKDSTKISLKNWYSFTFSKATINEAPNLDYYFDFEQTDAYSFNLEFNKAIDIKNRDNFTKKIENDYFLLESSITKRSGTNYLVSVLFVVKKNILPVAQATLLPEIAEQLDQLNNFTLELARN